MLPDVNKFLKLQFRYLTLKAAEMRAKFCWVHTALAGAVKKPF